MRREEQAKARKVGGSPILHKLKGRVKGHGACLFYPKRNGELMASDKLFEILVVVIR